METRILSIVTLTGFYAGEMQWKNQRVNERRQHCDHISI